MSPSRRKPSPERKAMGRRNKIVVAPKKLPKSSINVSTVVVGLECGKKPFSGLVIAAIADVISEILAPVLPIIGPIIGIFNFSVAIVETTARAKSDKALIISCTINIMYSKILKICVKSNMEGSILARTKRPENTNKII